MKTWLIKLMGGYTEEEYVSVLKGRLGTLERQRRDLSVLKNMATAVDAPWGFLPDGYPRTHVQAKFGDGVTPSMHRKLEQHLKDNPE